MLPDQSVERIQWNGYARLRTDESPLNCGTGQLEHLDRSMPGVSCDLRGGGLR